MLFQRPPWEAESVLTLNDLTCYCKKQIVGVYMCLHNSVS